MSNCIYRRKLVPERVDRGGTLRYAWLRAPPLRHALKINPKPHLGCLTQEAPYEGGQRRSSRRAHQLFAKRTLNISDVSTPVFGKQFTFDITVKAAISPIGYARDVPMLHRVEVNVVDMPFEIGVITDCMLPITALPDALFSLSDFAH